MSQAGAQIWQPTGALHVPTNRVDFHRVKNFGQFTSRLSRMLLADARRPVLPAPVKPTPLNWSDNEITLAWLGHSTVLINFYGVTILTDPVFGERIGVRTGLGTFGPKRYVSAALTPDELPPIDVLLISHAHMDHLDMASLERMRSVPFVVTAKNTTDLLRRAGLSNVHELGWGERTVWKGAKGELEISAIEVRHWGERWPSKLERGYNGYVLRREGRSLLFGGDTADTPAFSNLRSHGPFTAALMPIGAYHPWIRSHCTPEQALAMANSAGAQYFVPIHNQTFRLSDEPMTEPLERISAALSSESDRLALRRIGETFVCPPR